MLFLDDGDDFGVNVFLRFRRASQGRVAAEVFIGDRFHGDHVEFVRHAVAGDHGPGQLGRLFDVVRSACRDLVKDDFFGSPAAGEGGNLVFQFFPGEDVFILLVDLHGVAQGARRAGDDGDFLDRCRMTLEGSDQSMADFVVGDGLLFVVRQDGILLLVAGDDDFDAFFQVGLADGIAVVADGAQGGFIDDIGQFGAGSAGGHAGDGVEIDVVAEDDFLGMGLEDGFTACQVRQFDRDAAVETAWPQQGRVQRFRPVRRGQDDDIVVGVETVHFRQQLVQRLFPFAVAHGIACTLLTDSVDFIDEDDARCLLLGLLEEVADLGSPHADEHFDKFRTGNGEEGYTGFASDGFGQHGLAGARRADEEDAFRHLGPDFGVFIGMVEKIDNFRQVFLGFIFTGDVIEMDAVSRRDIDLDLVLGAEHERIAAAAVHEPAVEIVADAEENQDRQDPGDEEIRKGRILFLDDFVEGDLGLVQAFRQLRVVDDARAVFLAVFVLEENLVFFNLDVGNLFVFGHVHERPVVDLFHALRVVVRPGNGVEYENDSQSDDIVE